MSKFPVSPGPWKFGFTDDLQTPIIVDANDDVVCVMHEGVATKDGKLMAAAPELLEAQTMGASLNTPDFMDWLADRLVNVYGESPIVDYVLSLRDRAKAGRAAIAKATGGAA